MGEREGGGSEGETSKQTERKPRLQLNINLMLSFYMKQNITYKMERHQLSSQYLVRFCLLNRIF